MQWRQWYSYIPYHKETEKLDITVFRLSTPSTTHRPPPSSGPKSKPTQTANINYVLGTMQMHAEVIQADGKYSLRKYSWDRFLSAFCASPEGDMACLASLPHWRWRRLNSAILYLNWYFGAENPLASRSMSFVETNQFPQVLPDITIHENPPHTAPSTGVQYLPNLVHLVWITWTLHASIRLVLPPLQWSTTSHQQDRTSLGSLELAFLACLTPLAG